MGAQAGLVAFSKELPLASHTYGRGAHTTIVYACFTMSLVFEDCVTVLKSEASVGTGSLQLHFTEYYPKVGYTIGDVLAVMMNKNPRGYYDMCKCHSIVHDGILHDISADPTNPDPIKISFSDILSGGGGGWVKN